MKRIITVMRGNIRNFRMCVISALDAFSLGLEVRSCWSFGKDKELIMSYAAGVLEGNSPHASEITLLRLMYHGHSGGMEVILIRVVSYFPVFLVCIIQQSDGCHFLRASWIFHEKGKVALAVLAKVKYRSYISFFFQTIWEVSQFWFLSLFCSNWLIYSEISRWRSN